MFSGHIYRNTDNVGGSLCTRRHRVHHAHTGAFFRSRLAIFLAVVAIFAALAGWPAAPAHAASGKCADLFNVTKPTPGVDQLPGFTPTGGTAPSYPLSNYQYENPGENARDLQLPGDPDVLKSYGTDTSGKMPGTKEHVYAAWNRYVAGRKAAGKTPLPYSKWLNRYVPNMGNNNRGVAYEKYATENIGLGDDWMCQESIPGAEEDRVFDAVNHKEKIAYEFKSGNNVVAGQLAKDARIAARTGYRIQYVFGSKPRTAAVNAIKNAGLNEPYTLEATPEMNNPAPPVAGAPENEILEPDPVQNPTEGAFNDLIGGSGENAAEQAAVDEADEELGALSGALDQEAIEPGGIDFSTMQLRYVSDAPGSAGVQYSFQAGDTTGDTSSFGGLQDAQLTSDSMFTWLAMDPVAFWVNLNPDQPDKIIDSTLAKTDAGRILLTSDLTLKHTVAALQDPTPDNPTGKEYWKELKGTNDTPPCTGTYRVWIEPDTTTVRESGNELYVISAPLKVQAQRLVITTPPSHGHPCTLPQDLQDYNLGILQKVIAPKAQEIVNNDPRFADLRRVYASRVVAEWLRERDKQKPGAYHSIIGSGNIGRWPARTPWDVQKVYTDYVKSYKDGDASFEITYPVNGVPEQFTYVTGGVYFTNAPHAPIPEQTFQTTYKTLPTTVTQSQQAAVHYQATTETWMGGGPLVKSQPSPPPSSHPSSPPSHTPSTPPSTAVTPSASATSAPPGGLANTGASVTPYGIAAIAALAAGSALVVWRRYRLH